LSPIQTSNFKHSALTQHSKWMSSCFRQSHKLLITRRRKEEICQMAAPPNVADAEAQAALNLMADVAGPPSVRAVRSSKRLRLAENLHQLNRITEGELGEHEGFHARCAFNAGGGPGAEEAGVPPWFGPAMAAALQPVQDHLNDLQGQLNNFENNIEARMNNFEARVNNFESRQINSVASDAPDPLRELTNQAGVAFADFPDTLEDLNAMNGNQMRALLIHYGIAPGVTNIGKMQKIKKFIGMRIA
jgi:hypothetical protein